jgi:hypothetical protein
MRSQALRVGTAKPSQSEDLWAQVESLDAGVPHSGAELPIGGGYSEGLSKPARCAGDVGTRLNLPDVPGRLGAEPRGAWCWKPYWGKPTVRNFWEGGWKRDYGSRTEAHAERRGKATGP